MTAEEEWRPDPVMEHIMDMDERPVCQCTRGEPCVKPSVPGDLLCAGCITYCVPLARGLSPWPAP